MPSKEHWAKQYAEILNVAAQKDVMLFMESTNTVLTIDKNSYLLKAILDVGSRLDSLNYDSDPTKSISDEDKQDIVDLIAQELEYPRPKRLGGLLKEGSVDALLQVAYSIEQLLAALRR